LSQRTLWPAKDEIENWEEKVDRKREKKWKAEIRLNYKILRTITDWSRKYALLHAMQFNELSAQQSQLFCVGA